jgi:heme/copper-type cytochrome/quinol oxidase subunit 3
MSISTTRAAPRVNQKIIPDQVFAMLVLIFTEVMFFIALISAFVVIKGSRASWAVPANVTLPIALTAYNTLVLFASGALLWYCGRQVQTGKSLREQRSTLATAILCGSFFVGLQGYEWVQLIGYGLTMKSSIFGACFFLLIGSHALHAVAGILAMLYLYVKSSKKMQLADCRAVQIFWFFVVGIWPVLYGLVYFDKIG